IPVCPIDIDFDVPVFGGAKGNADNGELREADGSLGWSGGRIRIGFRMAAIIFRSQIMVFRAEGPLFVRLPADSGIEPNSKIIAHEFEEIPRREADPLFTIDFGIV